jgi:hypothetical protein
MSTESSRHLLCAHLLDLLQLVTSKSHPDGLLNHSHYYASQELMKRLHTVRLLR